jgi:hypothetical protein
MNTLELPSSLTDEELRAKAERCRRMAGTAGDPRVHAGLLRLAQRFEALADARQQQSSDD